MFIKQENKTITIVKLSKWQQILPEIIEINATYNIFCTNIQKKVYVKKIAEIRLFGQDERFIGRSRNITSWQKSFQALLKLFLEVLSFLKSCSKLLECSLCDLGTIVGYKCYSFTSANFEQILFKEKHGICGKNNFLSEINAWSLGV